MFKRLYQNFMKIRISLTGHALTKILTLYRWHANCGKAKKAKAVQVKLLTRFINYVFTENFVRGRALGRYLEAPLTYKEIEDVMEVAVWCKIDKNLCIGSRDPYAFSAANSATSGLTPGGCGASKRGSMRNRGRRRNRRGAKGKASAPDHP